MVFERAEIGIVIGDMDGRVIESNPAFDRMLGYTRQELCNKPFAEYTHPDDALMEWPMVQEVLSDKRDYYEVEKRYIRKDGQIIWVRLIGNIVKIIRSRLKFAMMGKASPYSRT